MSALTCPHCAAFADFQLRATQQTSSGLWGLFICTSCERPITAAVAQSAQVGSPVWPQAVGGKEFLDVPEAVARDASEAHLCLSVDAVRAAVVMARRIVQGVAIEKGATRGTLQMQIDWLRNQEIITAQMHGLAHELRLIGNEGAHVDPPTSSTVNSDPDDEELPLDLTREDATEVLELMDSILNYVYQQPAKLQRIREKRAARGS